jgi:hypothetical protein
MGVFDSVFRFWFSVLRLRFAFDVCVLRLAFSETDSGNAKRKTQNAPPHVRQACGETVTRE